MNAAYNAPPSLPPARDLTDCLRAIDSRTFIALMTANPLASGPGSGSAGARIQIRIRFTNPPRQVLPHSKEPLLHQTMGN